MQRTHTTESMRMPLTSNISTLNLNKAPRPGVERAPTSTNLTRPLPIQRLEGKVVMITGGGGKVGVESAGRLLVEGCNVALVDIDQNALEAAIPVLKVAIATGVPIESRLLTIVADATKEADVEACTKKVLQRFDKLDAALLNCCHRGASKSIFDVTEDDFDRIMTINAKSAFLGVKYAATAMQTTSGSGSIIIRSSIAGLRGFPNLISYSASKFALRGIALTAAEELGPLGIRVNTIHTSIIQTTGYKDGWSQEKLRELKEETALDRFSSPDDVASVVAFLVSEDSKFMTGGHLKIDGGCVAV